MCLIGVLIGAAETWQIIQMDKQKSSELAWCLQHPVKKNTVLCSGKADALFVLGVWKGTETKHPSEDKNILVVLSSVIGFKIRKFTDGHKMGKKRGQFLLPDLQL